MSDNVEFYPAAHERLVVILVEALSTALDDPVIQADPETLPIAQVLFDAVAENGAALLEDPSGLPARMAGALQKLKALRDPRNILLAAMVAQFRAEPGRWKSRAAFVRDAKSKTGLALSTVSRALE